VRNCRTDRHQPESLRSLRQRAAGSKLTIRWTEFDHPATARSVHAVINSKGILQKLARSCKLLHASDARSASSVPTTLRPFDLQLRRPTPGGSTARSGRLGHSSQGHVQADQAPPTAKEKPDQEDQEELFARVPRHAVAVEPVGADRRELLRRSGQLRDDASVGRAKLADRHADLLTAWLS
jgi:hypothetical protein